MINNLYLINYLYVRCRNCKTFHPDANGAVQFPFFDSRFIHMRTHSNVECEFIINGQNCVRNNVIRNTPIAIEIV